MNLPARISMMMAVTVVVFLATLTWSINSLRLAMDARAQDDSIRLVGSEIAALRTANEVVNADYNQWDEAFARISAQDLVWIGENYSFAVTLETSFDRLAVFDGPYAAPMTWGSGAGYMPDGEHVGKAAIEAARNWLRRNAAQDRSTVLSFNAIENGLPVIYSASFIIPHTNALAMPERIDDLPISMMGRTLSQDRLGHISDVLSVSDLEFTTGDAGSRPHWTLEGIDGSHLGHLVWTPPRPGTDLVKALMPLLTMVILGCMGLAGVIIFLTRRMAVKLVNQEAQAATLARTDTLTGLPNRLAFNEFLADQEKSGRHALAVLFIDIDDFKRINDEAGHAGGDDVVLALAQRLSTLRQDGLFLARIGGDEFVAVYSANGHLNDKAGALAETIAAQMQTPFAVGTVRFEVSVSQGLAVRNDLTVDRVELVRRANAAMYQAKRDGRGHWRSYDGRMARAAQEDRKIEAALRRDIAAKTGFAVYYQPLVSAKTERVLRAEALVRWTPVDLGPVAPDRFIPLAEASGLIIPMGRLLLDQICQDLTRSPGMQVSINISPIQLQSANFLDELPTIVAHHGISPDRIEIELTEGVIVENPDAAAWRLHALRELGFRTALDDFGTGFSSIGYLRRMKFDTLKIDRSFLSADPLQEDNFALIQSMIQLGHSLGQSVVCEGVETDRQVARLRELGCDAFQGFHYGKPAPYDEFAANISAMSGEDAA